MQPIRSWRFLSTVYTTIKNYERIKKNIFLSKKSRIISTYMCKSFHNTHELQDDQKIPQALRDRKPKSDKNTMQHFVDMKQVCLTEHFI